MDSINKTLYIPLYGKAYASERGLFLRDEKAEEIWKKEGFALKGKAKSKWLAYTMGMRAAVFDRWTAEKLQENPDAMVLHIGCGLDARVERVEHEQARWIDIDFPEVIEERKRYFAENETYTMLGADVRQTEWLKAVPDAPEAVVVMEGVSMYLQLPELQGLLKVLGERFRKVHLLMDTYTVFAAKATRYKNPINTVGVNEVYGFDTPEETIGTSGFRFLGEHDLTPDEMITQLPRGEQRFFKTMFAGKTAKKIYRLYTYER